jgi:drug/metabolite transporter (DMT)-like permease
MAEGRLTKPIIGDIPQDTSIPDRASALAQGARPQTARSRVDLLLLSVTLIWGMNFAIMKGLYTYFDPFAFTFLRFIIALPTLILILKLRGLSLGIELADLPAITGLGLLANTIYQMLFVSGLAHTKAGNAALIGAAAPIFAYLTGVLLKREWYSHRVLAGILLSFAGVSMIALFGAQEIALGANWKGDLLILVSALCWGWYTGAAARLVIKYGALRLTVWVMLTGTLLMIPPFLPSLLNQDWLSIPLLGWLGFCYSTFLSIVYSYLIWAFALQHIGVSRTAIYSNLTPMVALLGGWLLLKEQPAIAQFAGVALILSGIFIVRSKKSAFPIRGAGLRMAGLLKQKAR